MKETQRIPIDDSHAEGYVIPLGAVNLVLAVTASGGVLGCGAIDVDALERLHVPAATVSGVADLDELLAGKVGRVNAAARRRGVEPGMRGDDALRHLR